MKKIMLGLILAAAVFLAACTNVQNNQAAGEILCGDDAKTLQACTKEYVPVCGKSILNTGKELYQTFGNACTACASMKVVSYTKGGCPPENRKYLSKSPEECSRMGVWQCDEGFSLFSDDTGCGCDPILIGGQRDDHGCIIPTGFGWNDEIGACARSWELDESQKKAAKIAVAPLSYYTTIVNVTTYKCPGCFDVTIKRNDAQEIFTVKLVNWTVSA